MDTAPETLAQELPETADQTPTRSRPQWGRILVWVALFGFLTLIAFGLINSQEKSVPIGSKAPQFSLTSFDGNQMYNLENLRGKVVVVNVWASWCVTCKDEAADLESAWKYYQPRGDVVFLGADYVDTEPEAKAYLAQYGITYPNGPDLKTNIYHAFRATGVPETYIIDKNGILAYVLKGPFSSEAQIRAAIDPLLEQ